VAIAVYLVIVVYQVTVVHLDIQAIVEQVELVVKMVSLYFLVLQDIAG